MYHLTADLPAYPPAILRAYTVVFQHKFFKGLTSKSREILGEIVIRLSTKNLHKPIWFKRQNVAKKLQCDRKTVYNALRKLEQLDLIERHDQAVTAEGFFECSSISATPTLIKILGFGNSDGYPQPSSTSNSNRGENSGRINMGVNNVYVVYEQPSQDAIKTSIPKKQKNLWDDENLSFLRSSGLSQNGVYALMALCKKNRQRLSSVVACLKLKLERLTKGRLFAYLKTCIQSGANFTKKEVELNDVATARGKMTKYQQFLKTFQGRTLRDSVGRTVEIMDGASPVADVLGKHIGSLPTQQVFDLYESGEFKITLNSRMREGVKSRIKKERAYVEQEIFLRDFAGKILRNLRGGYITVTAGICPAKDVDGTPMESIPLERVIEATRMGFLFL